MASQVASLLPNVTPVEVLLCGAVFLGTLLWYRRWAGLPPGPWGVPILGLLPRIMLEIRSGSQAHLLFERLARQYGPVVCFKLVNKTVVILNDYESVRQAFHNPDLCDRPPNTLIAEGMKSEGVAMSSGDKWKDLRRFSLSVLRSFGVGKSSYEEQISTEATALIQEMSSYQGHPFNPKYLFGNATANVICAAVVGKRYDYSDAEFSHLMRVIHRVVDHVGSGGIRLAVPALRAFMRNKAEVFANFGELREFLLAVVAAHRSDFDSEQLRDFIDAYLKEIVDNEEAEKKARGSVEEDERCACSNGVTNGDTHGPTHGSTANCSHQPIPNKSLTARHPYISDANIVGTVANLFVAGMETTATTLQWCILYMAGYPDIQKRVQDEIDAVVGRNRRPRMSDKPELNFTRAFLWEVQRIAAVAPLGLPHAAAADAEVFGYRIPRGSIVLSNLWAVFHDPKVWPEPEAFRPGRFLDNDGLAVKREELIPFSTGRRTCIGEHLAKMELFIFFTYFMHQFTFRKPDNSPPYTFKALVGLTHYPAPFEICAIQRD